jgi:4-amino-4-deoxy-L-arabinose transferase-like glycosyltransferase
MLTILSKTSARDERNRASAMNAPCRITPLRVAAIVLVGWACIYLPGLGVPEFKGEETTRLLPAIEMLQTGQWAQPYIGGEVYRKKPPGINWIVAAFFAVGGESEFVARLPSAILLLAAALQIVWMPVPGLGVAGRGMCAIALLTNVSMVEKGRLIEIEATYAALTSLAIFGWLSMWSRGRRGWRTWLQAGALLTVGMMVKGPFQAGLFYLVVLAVAWRTRTVRKLISLPHAAGLALVIGVGLGWMLLASRGAQAPGGATGRMLEQLWARLAPARIDWGEWLEALGKSLVNFLPWLLFVPLWWRGSVLDRMDDTERGVFRGLRLATVLGWIALNAMPGTEARYSIPVIPQAAVLTGWSLYRYRLARWERVSWAGALVGTFALVPLATAIAALALGAGALPWLVAVASAAWATAVIARRDRLRGTLRLTTLTGVVVALGMMGFGALSTSIFPPADTIRRAGRELAARVPPRETTYVLRPSTRNFQYYVRRPRRWLLPGEDIGDDVEYLVLREAALDRLHGSGALADRDPNVLYELPERIPGRWRLIRLAPRCRRGGQGPESPDPNEAGGRARPR